LPLAQALFSSPKSTMKDNDDGEIDNLSSTSSSVVTMEDNSTTGINSRHCDDSDADDDTKDHYTTPKLNGDKQQIQQSSILSLIHSPLNGVLFGKYSVTFVLIPAMLLMAHTFFGAPSIEDTQGQVSGKAITHSALALVGHLYHQYMVAIDEYPVLTKSLTTAIIQILGDWAAQRYEQNQEKDTTTIHSDKGYDLRRGLSLFADGLLLSGPLMHYCFEWMEDTWPTSEGEDGGGLTRPLATLCHVFVNDYVIDSTYIALSFIFTGIVEGYSLREIAVIVRKDFGATVRASWLTSLGLIPVEIMCFGYLSLSFRVLAMNFVDLLWGAIISFYMHRSRREDPKQGSEGVSAIDQQ